MASVLVRAFKEADAERVIELWMFGGLLQPWSDPQQEIARKLKVQRELFLVAQLEDVIVGVVMAGYDGHAGWISHLAVDLGQRRRGIGSALVRDAERRLRLLGCPHISLQVRGESAGVRAFCATLGFEHDAAVVCMAKRLERN